MIAALGPGGEDPLGGHSAIFREARLVFALWVRAGVPTLFYL
jgi:hypothetical protein